MIDSVPLNRAEIECLYSWHGGQASMLYAAASCGALQRGTVRPLAEDGSGPASDEEWLAGLIERLIAECEASVTDAREQGETDDERTLNGLITKCHAILAGTYETDREAFVSAYLSCALWCGVMEYRHEDDCPYLADDCDAKNTEACTCEDGGYPGSPELANSDDEHDESELSEACRAHLEQDAREFYTAHLADLQASTLDMEQAGHDLWLTRNGHGAGYWDRKHLGTEADAALDRLTDAAHACGDETLIVSPSGEIEVM